MLNIKIISVLICGLFMSCSKDGGALFIPELPLFKNSLNFKGTNETLDIITWNIENFPLENITQSYVLEIIDSMDVDIIALQEIKGANEFNNLLSILNDKNWVGFRSGNNLGSYDNNYQELAYLINTNNIDSYNNPYQILSNDDYYFAWREPFVLDFYFNNNPIKLINVNYKCCDGYEDRRLAANQKLHNYVNPSESVIIVGDFNDLLIDTNNVFEIFLNDNDYLFADYSIAQGSSDNWSYPSWPSHLDHILVTKSLFDFIDNTQTLLLEHNSYTNYGIYKNNVSDHRPVGIQLLFNP